MDRQPTLILRPSRGWRALDLGELWHYRELLYIFAWRDLKVRYRQTFLGALWVIGQPALSMLIFTFLFNRVARFDGPPGVPYPVFVLSGLLMWNFFANGVAKAGHSLIGQAFLISKVYFPRLIIPLSGTIVEVVDLGVTGILLAALMIWSGVVPGITILALPLLVILCALLAIGVGLWSAALNVEYRDVRVLIPFLLQLGMWATPVVYPLSLLPERYRGLAIINPMTGIVEGFRASLFGGDLPYAALLVSIGITAVVLVTGLYYFRRMERLFADLL
ncbi:MAG TPA: ABC transporter permease [Thermoanaerobaculia bacterium]|jgi:lipopolysaccharide transport system permease protein